MVAFLDGALGEMKAKWIWRSTRRFGAGDTNPKPSMVGRRRRSGGALAARKALPQSKALRRD